MRLLSLVLAALFLLAGIVFGALNPVDVVLDFHRWQLELPLGVALIGFALLGAMGAGLLLWFAVIWPQRRRLRRLERARLGATTLAESTPGDFSDAA